MIDSDVIKNIDVEYTEEELEEYFRKHGFYGVSLNETDDVIMLLYCDDLIIFKSCGMACHTLFQCIIFRFSALYDYLNLLVLLILILSYVT